MFRKYSLLFFLLFYGGSTSWTAKLLPLDYLSSFNETSLMQMLRINHHIILTNPGVRYFIRVQPQWSAWQQLLPKAWTKPVRYKVFVQRTDTRSLGDVLLLAMDARSHGEDYYLAQLTKENLDCLVLLPFWPAFVTSMIQRATDDPTIPVKLLWTAFGQLVAASPVQSR